MTSIFWYTYVCTSTYSIGTTYIHIPYVNMQIEWNICICAWIRIKWSGINDNQNNNSNNSKSSSSSRANISVSYNTDKDLNSMLLLCRLQQTHTALFLILLLGNRNDDKQLYLLQCLIKIIKRSFNFSNSSCLAEGKHVAFPNASCYKKNCSPKWWSLSTIYNAYIPLCTSGRWSAITVVAKGVVVGVIVDITVDRGISEKFHWHIRIILMGY